jgi:RNA polymerase sigma-70 factor, ECF subfamily
MLRTGDEWGMDDAIPGPDALRARETFRDRLSDWIRTQFEEQGPGLHRYLTRLTGDPALAEDLAQECFLRLFEERTRGRDVERWRAWLFQVGHNLAVDHLRRRGHEEWQGDDALGREADRTPSAESRLITAERHQRVRQALSLLSPQERQAMELRAEGLRFREVAEAMGLHVSTVATFLSRAINKIARQMHD